MASTSTGKSGKYIPTPGATLDERLAELLASVKDNAIRLTFRKPCSQGFDAEAVLYHINKQAREYQNKPELERRVKIKTGNKEFTLSNRSSVETDATILCTTYGKPRLNYDEVESGLPTLMREHIAILRSKYHILRTYSDGRKLQPTELTIPRFIACFPFIMSGLVHSGEVDSMFTLDEAELSGFGLSRCVLTLSFASTIPKVWAKGNHFLSFYVAVYIDKLAKKPSLKGLTDIFHRYKTMYNSVVSFTDKRKEFQIKVDHGTPQGFKEGFLRAQDRALQKLTQLRGQDEDFGRVVELLRTL